MEKLNFVFLIREDSRWEQLIAHLDHLKKEPERTGEISVVAIGTALLSCLRSTHLESLKSDVTRLTDENVRFYLCINTLSRYGITEEMLLPEIEIAREGGVMKVACLEAVGYHSFTLG